MWGWVKACNIITIFGEITIHSPVILGYHPGSRLLTHNHVRVDHLETPQLTSQDGSLSPGEWDGQWVTKNYEQFSREVHVGRN